MSSLLKKPRSILHIDMDAFYASVEQRDNPSLKGLPVIVGGHIHRGVVLAASYEVRPFGVRSAMPMARAIKLAPQAIVVAPRPGAYAEASEAVFSIFEQVTPLIEPLSLDEAFLDVSGSQTLFGKPWDIAQYLREQIAREVKLPCSAGIAESKFIAKVASDFAKPNGQKEVPAGTSKEFLAPLPVSRLWGVGPKTEEMLKAHGLLFVSDIAKRSAEELVRKFGKLGSHLWKLANGIDDRPVIPDSKAHSIGAQDTFEEDLLGKDALAPRIHAQALRVARRLRNAKIKTRTVQLSIKYEDFSSITRQSTLDLPTDDGQVLYREALSLLSRVDLSKRIRLTGVSAQQLGQNNPQMMLFDSDVPNRNEKLNLAIDKIAAKYGTTAVLPADVAGVESDDEFDAIRRRMGASALDVKK